MVEDYLKAIVNDQPGLVKTMKHIIAGCDAQMRLLERKCGSEVPFTRDERTRWHNLHVFCGELEARIEILEGEKNAQG